MPTWFKVALLALLLLGLVLFFGGIAIALYSVWKAAVALFSSEWLASAAWLLVGGTVGGIVHGLGVMVISLAVAMGRDR